MPTHTPDQIKGDSQRLQLELSTKYCEEEGLKLDTTLTMKDLGFSWFTHQRRRISLICKFRSDPTLREAYLDIQADEIEARI